MIIGIVNANLEAIVHLRIRGLYGQDQEIEGIIDTGFNGFLTLPSAVITVLGLLRLGRGRAILANGSETLFDIYEATVIWDGQPRIVELDATDVAPLVGMSLLYGYDLRIHAVNGGCVIIEASS